MGLFINETYPVSEKLYDKGFYLLSGMALSYKDLEFSANTLLDILKNQ